MTENGRVVVPARLRKLLGVEGTRAELVRRQIKWANRVGLVAEALALSD